jgi:hypothetical protein
MKYAIRFIALIPVMSSVVSSITPVRLVSSLALIQSSCSSKAWVENISAAKTVGCGPGYGSPGCHALFAQTLFQSQPFIN